MVTRHRARLEAERVMTDAVQKVLFSPDLYSQLWQWLPADSKEAMRQVSVAMRDQVDASVTRVTIRTPFTACDLSRALTTWKGVNTLFLDDMRDMRALAPLATAQPKKLRSITIHEVGGLLWPWTLQLGPNLAAQLEVIDVSFCPNLIAIDSVRACVQLRCMRVAWCRPPLSLRMLSLEPLATCTALEEVWMAHTIVETLDPLRTCVRLRSLDLDGSGSGILGGILGDEDLADQVANLRAACPQLADPATVQLDGLVQDLMCRRGRGVHTGCTAAGVAIPRLVELLGAAGAGAWSGAWSPPADAVEEAAWAIEAVVFENPRHAAEAAAAIPTLVMLLRLAWSSDDMLRAASRALCALCSYGVNSPAAVAAGAIPALVALLEDGVPFRCRHVLIDAAYALEALLDWEGCPDFDAVVEHKHAVSAAGGIPALVALLGGRYRFRYDTVRQAAMAALYRVVCPPQTHDLVRLAAVAAGAVRPVVRLLSDNNANTDLKIKTARVLGYLIMKQPTVWPAYCCGLVQSAAVHAGAVQVVVRWLLHDSDGTSEMAARAVDVLERLSCAPCAPQTAAAAAAAVPDLELLVARGLGTRAFGIASRTLAWIRGPGGRPSGRPGGPRRRPRVFVKPWLSPG